MRQNVRALAALTSSGLAAPPAPREFMAVHIPGAERLHKPRIVMLKKVDLCHLTVTVLAWSVWYRMISGIYLDAVDLLEVQPRFRYGEPLLIRVGSKTKKEQWNKISRL
jgi:hypothetical protein